LALAIIYSLKTYFNQLRH